MQRCRVWGLTQRTRPRGENSLLHFFRCKRTRGPSTALSFALRTATSLRMTGWRESGGAVELAIDVCVAHYGLDVFAGFGEGDGLYEFLDVAVFAGGLPVADAVVAGVVGG
jgi:hypothetical protein